jgi:deferrochelatase/peroxidase EfeB
MMVGLAASAGASLAGGGMAKPVAEPAAAGIPSGNESVVEPFWGAHQAGIATPAQRHSYVAAFDLVAGKRDDVIGMLRAWTDAASVMTRNSPASEREGASDSGKGLGLPPSRLTLTFGFGAGLFVKNGDDRYNLAAQRPQALVDLPAFDGDELIATRTGGDLSVQACAEDPLVAFDAVRQLTRLAHRLAELRWGQAGFLPADGSQQTPRNLLGFKDGTRNPSIDDAAAMRRFVWVDDEGPGWMRGGSYVVLRRIRVALEHWDRMPLEFQQATIGRDKASGAPLGRRAEFDPPDLDALGKDGDPVIPESAHIRLAAPERNGGAQILRRPYSYDDGVNFVAERWPPWRKGMEFDAGLLFICYQRDPRSGFIAIFDKLAKSDMLNQFVTHTGGGLFACPGGVQRGQFIGQSLFDASRSG